MARALKTIQVDPGSEIARLLDEAAENEIVLEMDGVNYHLSRIDADAPSMRRKRLEPERLLDIIGIGASAEGSNIARFKDKYIADAADHRGE